MNSQLQSAAPLVGQHLQEEYSQLTTHYDEKHQTMWYYMHGSPRPCFTPTLLNELIHFADTLQGEIDSPEGRDIRYMVLASQVPGVFNLGGDLNLFRSLVESGDRQGLAGYAIACVDVWWINYTHLGRDLTTISLVQGDALGGGFEGALSSNVVVAEKSARMGFPEVMFNLFPGMGAYSLLSRKLGPVQAEQMITGGKVYSAEELHEMGVVDVIAEDGEGEMAVYDYIRRENRASNGLRAFRAAKHAVDAITYDELIKVADIWVDAALRLKSKDLRMMERLVARQTQKATKAA